MKRELNILSKFPYIEKLLEDENQRRKFQEDFDNGKLILCDPGKRSPLYLMASNSIIHEKKKSINSSNFGISYWNGHKILNYTNSSRLKFTKRKKYGKLIEKWKNELHGISNISVKDLEKELCIYNSKSCYHMEFLWYVKGALELESKVRKEYDTIYLRKLNWYGYLNKEKHENELLNCIANEFGNDIKIIIGDWSGKGSIKYISTPNLSLKRKLSERFKVYLIDEYLTSKIHYKHHIKCDNLSIKINNDTNLVNKKLSKTRSKKKSLKKKLLIEAQPISESNIIQERVESNQNQKVNSETFYYKQLHAVLTYKIVIESNGCNIIKSDCLNRDKNSVLNMETIVSELLKSGKRPSIFDRSSNRVNRKANSADATGANRTTINLASKNITSKKATTSKISMNSQN